MGNNMADKPADEAKESAESLLADIQKKITDAFDIFDHESNKTVDVREVGTIVRSLGCCPSEAELHDMLAEIEEEEPTGYIRFERFLPMMTHVLMERRYAAEGISCIGHRSQRLFNTRGAYKIYDRRR